MRKLILLIVLTIYSFNASARSDCYAGHDSVSWNGETWSVESTGSVYVIKPKSNRYNFDDIRYKSTGEIVPIYAREMPEYAQWYNPPSFSSSPQGESGQVLHNYIMAGLLRESSFNVYMWINYSTGIVEDVAFLFDKDSVYATLDIENYIRIAWRIREKVFFDVYKPRNHPPYNFYLISVSVHFRDVEI